MSGQLRRARQKETEKERFLKYMLSRAYHCILQEVVEIDYSMFPHLWEGSFLILELVKYENSYLYFPLDQN